MAAARFAPGQSRRGKGTQKVCKVRDKPKGACFLSPAVAGERLLTQRAKAQEKRRCGHTCERETCAFSFACVGFLS